MFTPRPKKDNKSDNCSCGKPLGKRAMTDKCAKCLNMLEFQLIKDRSKLSTPKA